MSSRSSHNRAVYYGESLSPGAFGLGADVQNGTAASLLIWDDRRNRGATACRLKTMLFTIAVLIAGGGALIIQGARCRARQPSQSRVDERAMARRIPRVASIIATARAQSCRTTLKSALSTVSVLRD